MNKDEIWELKPEEPGKPQDKPEEVEKPGKGKEEPRPQETVKQEGEKPEDKKKKDIPELLSIEERDVRKGKKDEPAEEEEGTHVARQETSSVADADRPQVIEPGKEKSGLKMPELKGEPGKKIERMRPTDFASAPEKSRLLTAGLAVALLFFGCSIALLVLPFFGIETIPDDYPVIREIIDFYRNLPIFPR